MAQVGVLFKCSYSPLGPYPTFVQQKETGRVVPVVQAFYYSKYLGHLKLDFDRNGDLKVPVEKSGVSVTAFIPLFCNLTEPYHLFFRSRTLTLNC